MIFINEYDLINEYQGKPCLINKVNFWGNKMGKTSFLIDYVGTSVSQEVKMNRNEVTGDHFWPKQ